MPGFSRKEQTILAQLVIGHRGDMKKMADIVGSSEMLWYAVLSLRLVALFCRARLPLAILTLLLLVAGAVALRNLFGFGDVFGGGLLPAPENIGKAWEAALSLTVGLAGSDAPWLLVEALLSTLTFGSPQLLIFLALGLTPLLAGLSAHTFLRRFEVPRTTSAIAAGLPDVGRRRNLFPLRPRPDDEPLCLRYKNKNNLEGNRLHRI